MRESVRASHRGSEGFALVLAILALMLLTSVGITMSLQTSTELQIANNYKWSQQALYNAEAGLEAGRRILQSEAWGMILPAPRGGSWAEGSAPAPPGTVTGRNFENRQCDVRGGVGYGTILVDSSGNRYENIDNYLGQGLRGTFTLWVRRPLIIQNDGTISDLSEDDNSLVLTAEGAAPFGTAQGTGAFVQSRRAVRVLEWKLTRELKECATRRAQQGSGQEGGGFGACSRIDDSTMQNTMAAENASGSGAQLARGNEP